MRVRTVDAAQAQKRMDDLDFDMAVALIPESEVTGQRADGLLELPVREPAGHAERRWHLRPVVDALVADVIAAPNHAALVTASRALDRVLLWGWYMVPQWHLQKINIAYWNRFGHPSQPVRTGVAFGSWWVDPTLAAATDAARAAH